jgi:hypothetical protein
MPSLGGRRKTARPARRARLAFPTVRIPSLDAVLPPGPVVTDVVVRTGDSRAGTGDSRVPSG